MLLKRALTDKPYTVTTLLRHDDELVDEVVLQIGIRAFWVIQIPQCSTCGQISCDTMIYHSLVEHCRSACVSTSNPLTENVESGEYASIIPWTMVLL